MSNSVWADGHYERLGALCGRGGSALNSGCHQLSPTEPAAQAAKAATTTIPDRFHQRLRPDRERPCREPRPTNRQRHWRAAWFSVPLISKRLELLHELAPAGTTVGVLVNPSNPNAEANERAIESAAKVIGLTVAFVGASGEPGFEDAFTKIARQRFGALIVSADGLFASRRKQLVALAARHGVPTMYFQREFVDAREG